jgi:hypothetical protein
MKCKIKNYKTPGRKYRGQTSGHWNGQEFSKQDPMKGNTYQTEGANYRKGRKYFQTIQLTSCLYPRCTSKC